MGIFEKILVFWINSVRPSNKSKTKYLRKKGAVIGEQVRFNCKTNAFGTEPYLISIGDDCLIATNVQFITHDGGVKVLNSMKRFGNQSMDKVGQIHIGNNVYIGMGAYILPNVTIGDNCIIGAGAIVTKDIPEGHIAVGVPARITGTIEAYYQRIRNRVDDLSEMDSREKQKYLTEKYMQNGLS